MASIHKNHDWKKIQLEYDSGKTTEEVRALFSVSTRGIRWGTVNGKLKTRPKSIRTKMSLVKFPRKHTEETKKKLSKIQTEFLLKHPKRVPYRMAHSSKQSYPEKVFEDALKRHGIAGWEMAYPMSIYEYDFAFVDKKVDVEVDGGTHTQPNVIKIDKRRDDWSKSNGWKVIRFSAKRVKENVDECINELKHFMEPSL